VEEISPSWEHADRLLAGIVLVADVLADDLSQEEAARLALRVRANASELADVLERLQRHDAQSAERVVATAPAIGSHGGWSSPTRGPLEVGAVRVDIDGHSVTVDARPVRMPLAEFQLLRVLVANAGRVVPHQALQELAWGRVLHNANGLYSHMRRLRKAIEDDPDQPTRLRVVRGVGYCFEPM
jgi:DNA-binding response OmpR family regulator